MTNARCNDVYISDCVYIIVSWHKLYCVKEEKIMSEILKNLKQSIENRRGAMRMGFLKDIERQNKVITMQSCRAIDNALDKNSPEKEMDKLLNILRPKEYNTSRSLSRGEAVAELSKIRKELKCR